MGINTNGGWSDSPFISRDGQRLYFMYSRWDFGPWIESGFTQLPVLRGPDRPGLHESDVNPFDESDIYISTRNPDGSWGEPVNLGLNGPYPDYSGMEINGPNTFLWMHGNGAVDDVVTATRNPDGSWTPPVSLGATINDHSAGVAQDNPYMSADGNSLWFVSNRAGSIGGKDIWFSSKSSGVWSAPVNLGAPINTVDDEDQPWLSPVSNDVYWNGPQGIMHCVSNGSTCATTPDLVVLPGCSYPAEASMPDDGTRLYYACGSRTATSVQLRIVYSVRQGDGSWGVATPVD